MSKSVRLAFCVAALGVLSGPNVWTQTRSEPRSPYLAAPDNVVAVRAGRLFDAKSGTMLNNQVILLRGDRIAEVGASGFFRLGWDTVPRLPMTATIEVGNMPSSDRPTGVRLIYDVYFPLQSGLRLAARAGYAARNQELGGITAGGGVTFDF